MFSMFTEPQWLACTLLSGMNNCSSAMQLPRQCATVAIGASSVLPVGGIEVPSGSTMGWLNVAWITPVTAV